ncbi:MAG: hydrogenase maturation nickel metallochaperone HypA [Anaerolineae bacterium]|nr:hydrogenase maturation nickel metallochaperone HypA [Anaerolineae bacterium]
MHELAVTTGILDVALEANRQNGDKKITAIDLVIGELSSIVDDSVQFYFDMLSQDTLAEGAALRFRRVQATAYCGECGYQGGVSAPLPPFCPACGRMQLQVSGGREFYVESIEVKDEDSSSEEYSECK